MTIARILESAVQHHQAGRLAEAEALYRQILSAQPRHVEALHHLAVIAHQVGRLEIAASLMRQVAAMDPANAAVHLNLGATLAAQGLRDEAIAEFRRALECEPDAAEAHLNLGVALAAQGRLEEALHHHQRALQLEPGNATGHYNLANTLRDHDRLDEAVASYRRTLELTPDFPEAYNNLGIALTEQGQLDEAAASYRRAFHLRPGYVEAMNNLALALKKGGQLAEAVAMFRQVLQLRPDYVDAYVGLGDVLRKGGRCEEAIVACERALALRPDSAEALNNLGIALVEKGGTDAGIAVYRRALDLEPDSAAVHNNLGFALKEQGRLDEAIAAFRRAAQLEPGHAMAQSNLIYTLQFPPGVEKATIAEELERWNRRFGTPVNRPTSPYPGDCDPNRRLRIGYVSPEFRDHVTGRYLVPLFACHDRKNFEILCYSGVARADELTTAFRERADGWRNTLGMRDEALAEIIRRDRIDILADLTQHMAGNRLPVFAHRPAPIQVSFAGYPESTGLEAIQFRISDRFLEEGTLDGAANRREKVCLIDSFWCYDPCGADVVLNELPALKSGSVTFGCLNNFCKINEPVLRSWARLMAKVNDSRLVLLCSQGSHRQRALSVLQNGGIAADRVEFLEACPRRAYLERYHRIDIALDPFPCNGHTTTLDALWMGLPVVALAGHTAVSRGGISILTSAGLPELVAHTEADYIQIAVQLAADLPRLAELRRKLRARLEGSLLMDARRFAGNIEAAYRTMWRSYCEEQTLPANSRVEG